MPVSLDTKSSQTVSKHYQKTTASFSAEARVSKNLDTNAASITFRASSTAGIAELLQIMQALYQKINNDFPNG